MTEPKSPPKTPPLASPEHGNGLLYRGGLPGNRGGTGRPPSAIREAMRAGLEAALPYLLQVVNGEIEGDRLRAIDLLARYGLGRHDATEHTLPVLPAAERDRRLRMYVAQLRQAELPALSNGDPSNAG